MALDVKAAGKEGDDGWKRLTVTSLRDYCTTVTQDSSIADALYPPGTEFRRACDTLSDNPGFRGYAVAAAGAVGMEPTYGEVQRTCANRSSVAQGAYGLT